MAIAVRRPVVRHIYWRPNISVLGIVVPATVFIEVLVAGHFWGDILRAANAIQTPIAIEAPPREIVIAADLGYVVAQLIDTGEGSLLAITQAIRTAASGDFGTAMPNGRDRLIAILVDVDAVLARLSHIESEVRSINLKGLVAADVTHAEKQSSHGNAQLRNVALEVKQSHAGFRAQTDRSRSNLNFCARATVGPQVVSGGQRPVGNGVEPVSFAAGLK